MSCKQIMFGMKVVVILVSFILISSNQAVSEDLSGKVVETMNSSSYTYIHLDNNGKLKWVAVPETLVRVGDEIEVSSGFEMGKYTSPTLARSFDAIVFSPGIKNIKKRVVSDSDDSPETSGDTLKIEKASGDNAYTVEEIFGKKKDLDGKAVLVRGKVVKLSKFQGNNWIRIVDGSGSKKRGNHKLIITSEQPADKGTIITAKGIVRADKSFGALAYEVVLEKATITK